MKKTFVIFALLSFPFSFLQSEENFLLVNGSTNEIVLELGSHLDTRTTPASSFKIALSLMGFDSGVLKSQEEPVWDFQEGYVQFLDSWKTSQTPRSWMKNSCVWYSQLLAIELGIEKFQNYLKLLDYGNQDISGGLTRAWLSSSLKISPREQIHFLQKMVHEQLPLSRNAVQMTKSILFVDALESGWNLFGKTGLGREENLEIGWFIGWIEKEEKIFFFVYNIQEEKIDPAKRIPRVRQLLEQKIIRPLA